MKSLIVIFFCLICYNVVAQINPSGVPTQFSTGWFRHGWDQSDSGKIFSNRAPNFIPRFPGTVEFWQNVGVDSLLYLWTGDRWLKLIPGFDSISLSNRINLKLNKTDTTNKWWGLGKRWVDTVYRKNDSTIGFTINNGAEQTFQILGRSSGGGGGGGLTSVGLSMPSAFSVSGSPLTSDGAISVSGAGTTAQYIRGNGTLAIFDTTAIPNFYLKVRGLLSATSPITYNSTTGAVGILNATSTGTKGAATFDNTSFTDNSFGLISLNQPVSPGGCTNCNITWGVDGRPTAYSNGSGPAGASVDTIYRTPGKDSIFFTINSTLYAIKDSTGSAGTVTSVIGTANRVTVINPTTTPTIDIANTYVGQSSITTLGTVTTGIWNGTPVAATFGGTGQTTVTTGDLLYGSAPNTWSKLADVATGNALISGGVGVAPSWGKIGLTTHVSGILPIANGGTGTSSPSLIAGSGISIGGSWPNQTITNTSTGGTPSLTYKYVGFGGVGNTLSTGENEFQYDSIINRLLVDSILLKKVRGDTAYIKISKNTASKNAYFFGTSITYGYYTQAASGGLDTFRRWSTYVSRSLGWNEINYGVPAEVLQSRSPVVTNMVDNGIPLIPTYNSATDTAILLEFSINDCTKTGQGLTNYNTTNFITDYSRVIDSVTARGWPVSQIYVVASNYVDTSLNVFNSYSNQIAYYNATKTVTTTKGVNFIDVFNNSFQNRNYFFYADGLHPSNTGHSTYAVKVLQTIGATTVKNDQTLAVNGFTELQKVRIKQTDTTNINYQILGIDQYNNAIKIPNGFFIENNPIVPQYGGINMNGTVRANYLRATGDRVAMGYGAGLEMFYDGTTGRIYSFNQGALSWLPFSMYSTTYEWRTQGNSNILWTIDAFGQVNSVMNGDGAHVNLISNNSGGTSAFSMLQVGSNDVLGNGLQLRYNGAGYNVSGPGAYGASTSLIDAGANISNGLNFVASNASAGFKFYTGGSGTSNERMRLLSNGHFLINSTTDSRTLVQFNGSVAIEKDSLPIITSPSGPYYVLIQDTSATADSNRIKRILPSDLISGSGITSINSQTGASQTLAADNGLTATTTTNTVTYTLGGALTGFTQIAGASNSLVIGTSGSHLSGFTTYGDAINLFGNVRYGVEDYSTDANHTVPGTITFEELHDVLSTNRTLTMPSAVQQGQILTVVTRFSSGTNHFNLAAAITDNSTGSTFTQLDWGKRYDFYVNSALAWILISKY